MAVNFPDSPSDNQVFQTGGRSYKYNTALGGWKIVSSATSATDISDLTDTTNVIPDDISDLTDTTSLLFDRQYSSLSGQPTIPTDISDLTDTGSALSSGVTVHATQSIMIGTSPDAGTLHFVSADSSLYVKNSSGWYRLAQISNVTPTITNLTHTTNGTTETIANATSFTLTPGQNTVITLTATDPDFGQTLYYDAVLTSGTLSSVSSSMTQGSGSDINKFTLVPNTTGTGRNTITYRFDVTDGIGTAQRTASFEIAFIDWTATTQSQLIGQSTTDIDTGTDGFPRFGTSVAMKGNTFVAVAWMVTVDSVANVGALYIYEKSGGTWTYTQTLKPTSGVARIAGQAGTSPTPSQSAYIGSSESSFGGRPLHMSEDTIVVGAPRQSNGGAVYVYVKGTDNIWAQQAYIVPDEIMGTNDAFGESVYIDKDTLIVGAPGKTGTTFNSTNSDHSGAAYIFTRDGTQWTQRRKLWQRYGYSSNNQFGKTVCIRQLGSTHSQTNDIFAVSAPWDDTGSTNEGKIEVHRLHVDNYGDNPSDWSADLQPPGDTGQRNGQYPFEITPDGRKIIFSGTAGTAAPGKAWYFTRASDSSDSWSYQGQILPSSAASNADFGSFITYDNGILAIGATSDTAPAGATANAGTVYIFKENENGSFTEQAKIGANAPVGGEEFGCSIGLDATINDTLVVGMYDMDDGEVYIFEAG